jgi:hypothetical protein
MGRNYADEYREMTGKSDGSVLQESREKHQRMDGKASCVICGRGVEFVEASRKETRSELPGHSAEWLPVSCRIDSLMDALRDER